MKLPHLLVYRHLHYLITYFFYKFDNVKTNEILHSLLQVFLPQDKQYGAEKHYPYAQKNLSFSNSLFIFQGKTLTGVCPYFFPRQNKFPPVFSGIFIFDGYKERALKTNISKILKNRKIAKDIENRPVTSYSPAINFLTFGENIFLRYTEYQYEILKLDDYAFSSFVKSLRAWLVEDSFYKLGDPWWNKDIVKDDPFFTINFKAPYSARVHLE